MSRPKMMHTLIREAPGFGAAMQVAGLAADHDEVKAAAPDYAYGVEKLVMGLLRRGARAAREGLIDDDDASVAGPDDAIGKLVARHNRGLLRQGEFDFGIAEINRQKDEKLIDAIATAYSELPVGDDGQLVCTRMALGHLDMLARAVDWLSRRAIVMRKAADQENFLWLCAAQLQARRGRMAAE